jgi:type II secretory pathway pseudopilin PulG
MRRKAFTLVEVMLVAGIVTLLLSMALPVIGKARKVAMRARMKADLGVIEQGLEAYRLDHRDYPRLPGNQPVQYGYDYGQPDIDGAELLCAALIAPGPASVDGADGPGFRLRGTRGRVYGPYINPDSFKVASTVDGYYVIVDVNGEKIHYCPANARADVAAPNGFVSDYTGTGPRPLFDHNYLEYCLDLTSMRVGLGDLNANGQIDPGEMALCNGPYLLWGAGPNGVFGPDPGDRQGRSDDVTNFTP